MLACGPLPEEAAGGEAAVDEAEALTNEWASTSTVSGPFGVSRPVLEARRTGFIGPSVAFDGHVYLVVWEDSRTGRVFGARVKPDGRILDPAGIPIALSSGLNGGRPRVAYDGTQFVVVWVNGSYGLNGIFGAHVGSDGDVRRHFVIGFTDEAFGPPGIACAKRLCLVTYDVFGDEEDVILSARVDSQGHVFDSELLSPGLNYAFNSSVAWDGHQFLVVWSDQRGGDDGDIYANRVKPDGTVLDGSGVPLVVAPGGQLAPDVTWTGERFLVVWEDRRGPTPDIFGARVRRNLSLVEPLGFPIAAQPGTQAVPRLAHDGCDSLVVWQDTRGSASRVRGARVSDSGEVRDPGGFTLPSGGNPHLTAPAVASDGHHFFVAYSTPSDASNPFSGGNHILGTRVKHDTTIQDSPPLLFTRSASAQQHPASAHGDGKYLVVWQTGPDEQGKFLAALVDTRGHILTSPITLPTGPEAGNPSVAFDGHSFLVVWDEGESFSDTNIRGARVSRSGALMDASSLPIAVQEGRQAQPSVASDGDGFLVVWEDGRASNVSGDISDVYGARVSSSGTVLDPAGFLIAGTPATEQVPSVTSAGGQYFVAWQYFGVSSPGGPEEEGIRGARVAETGAVLDSPGLLIGAGPAFVDPPALSFDGANVLVAWAQGPEFEGAAIVAARVSGSGALLDPVPITVASGGHFRMRPTATFDGTHHWLAWEESTEFIFDNAPVDIRGARLRTDGTVRDPGGRPIARHDAPEYEPVLVSNGAGRSAVFYTEFVTEPDVMNTRIQGRVLTSPP